MTTPTSEFLDRLDRVLHRIVRTIAFGIALLLVGGGLFSFVASSGIVPALEGIEPAWVGLFLAGVLVSLGIAFFLFARDLSSPPPSSRRHPVLYLALKALLLIGYGLSIELGSEEFSAQRWLAMAVLVWVLMLGIRHLERRWPRREGARESGSLRAGEIRATSGASSVVP